MSSYSPLNRNAIFTTASSDSKLQFLHKLIGDENLLHTVNYRQEDFEKHIKSVTNDKGVDVLIDFVGKSHWNKNLGSLAIDGRMVILGLLSGVCCVRVYSSPLTYMVGLDIENTSLGPILFKRLQITGSTLRSRSPAYQTELVQRFGREVLPKISDQAFDEDSAPNKGIETIQVVIHQVYPLAEIVKATQDLEGDKSIGKIVIEVD